MKKQPWVSFQLAGVNLTQFGTEIPSPFVSLELDHSEVDSYTSWSLNITVGGNANKKMNVASFEALLYSAAQKADSYANSAGVPVSFAFGWLDNKGNVAEYTSYQGWTLKFNVSISGQMMTYNLTGYASLAMQMSMPVLNIPELCGFVQPSAVVEGLAKAVKADTYYNLDIDHCDAPTLVSHGAMTTSFTDYVRGSFKAEDDYDDFPGLLKLSKSYNSSRDAAGIKGAKKLSQLVNNLKVTNIDNYFKKSLTDNTVQCSSFSYWVDEPTMTSLGTIHYKCDAGLQTSYNADTLEYGTAHTNVISISGSYNGIAYDMKDMNFSNLGFDVDGSGNEIINDSRVVNSWSSSLADTFQTSSIINDINVLAMQFSGSFQVTLPGSVKQFRLAQPVTLVVMLGNTLSPISGIYNVMAVSHQVSNTFVTTLKLERLTMSSANQTAISQNIMIANNTKGYGYSSYSKTKNVKSAGKVDFGTVYPTFEHLVANSATRLI